MKNRYGSVYVSMFSFRILLLLVYLFTKYMYMTKFTVLKVIQPIITEVGTWVVIGSLLSRM